MQNSLNAWNQLILRTPTPHFLQTREWAQVKAKYGWIPHYAVWGEDGKFHVSAKVPAFIAQPSAAALILERPVLRRGMMARLSVLYSPKGPLMDWSNPALRARVLDDLQRFAKQRGAIFLKIDPDAELGRGLPDGETNHPNEVGAALQAELLRRGWRFSAEQIQFRNTVLLDLAPAEEDLLARMKQKTRYNVRLAEKKGVTVRAGNMDDLPMLYKMYAETSVRDGFVIRDEQYYLTVWRTFMSNLPPSISNLQSPISNLQSPISNLQSPISNLQSPISNLQSPISNLQSSTSNLSSPFAIPLIAEAENVPVAALFLFVFAGRAYYVYGMSRNVHREKMPTYLLQWEAIKFAKRAGCSVYDLWGAPEVFDESDSMWGVYRFKEGLGGEVVRSLGAYDFAPNFLWYNVYAELMPRLLDLMRSRGKEKVKRQIGA